MVIYLFRYNFSHFPKNSEPKYKFEDSTENDRLPILTFFNSGFNKIN